MQRWIATGASLALLVGCGGAAMPALQHGNSKAAVSAAEAVGAREHPKAALHLKMAQDALERAEGLMAREENREAALVLEQAQADAELAAVYARLAQTEEAAEKAQQRVTELRQQGVQ